ncbi:hypothetical protein TNCV_3164681 [Trichonephila clavipes]|nr:hypothetical protein TNCV_3164681 [Trichonephila clavipes]
MSRSGGQSDAKLPVFKSQSKLGTHLMTLCSRDERLCRPCSAWDFNPKHVILVSNNAIKIPLSTANREVTHSFPSANQNAPSPSISLENFKTLQHTITSSPAYSLPPIRLLQLSASQSGGSFLNSQGFSGHIHYLVMGWRNAPRSMFQ